MRIDKTQSITLIGIVTGLVLLLGCFWIRAEFSTHPTEPVNEEMGLTFPKAALEWEYEMLKNPETGKVPPGGVWKAYKDLKARGKIKSSDRADKTKGAYWNNFDDFFASLAVTKIVHDPNDIDTYYFCTGEGWYNLDAVRGAGIWKSTDAGATWAQIPSTDNDTFYYCTDMIVHPITSDLYVGTNDAGLMRSQDGGTTWQRVLSPGGGSVRFVSDLEVSASGTIFAGMRASAVYYSDSGDPGTWTMSITGLPLSGHGRIELACAQSDDNIVYAIVAESFEGILGVYKTTDKGGSWSSIPDPGGDLDLARKQAWYDLIIEVDPNDANKVIAGGLNLWRTENGGTTWQPLSHKKPDSVGYQYVHVDQHEIIIQNSDTILFGNDGGVWRTDNFTDDFPTIYHTNQDYNVTQFYTVAIHPDTSNAWIMGGTQDNGTQLSRSSGIGTFKRQSWKDGGWCAFHPTDTNILYTATQRRGMYRFVGGIDSPFDTITNANVVDDDVYFINPWELDPFDPDRIYMAATRLWRLDNASTADTTDWERASAGGPRISALWPSRSTQGRILVGKGNGRVYWIENADTASGSNSLIDADPGSDLPNGYVSSVYIDPADDDHCIVTISSYGPDHVWESMNATDASPTWTSVQGDFADAPVRWAVLHPANPDVCYIGTELGVFYTDDLNGASTVWTENNDGLANVPVYMFRIRESDGLIAAASHGRGIFTGYLDMTGTDLEIDWQERGPNNVGGRTRTIMVDPHDATGNTLWAGAVAGGIWKTENIPANVDPGTGPHSRSTFDLKLYPNPVAAGGSVHLQVDNLEAQNVKLYVTDIQGRVVDRMINGLLVKGRQDLSWKIPGNLGKGTYFIVLEGEKGRKAERLLIR